MGDEWDDDSDLGPLVGNACTRRRNETLDILDELGSLHRHGDDGTESPHPERVRELDSVGAQGD